LLEKMKSLLIKLMCLLSLYAGATAGAFAAVESDFYFKNSYGRGVGTIPVLECPDGKEGIAGLCYEPCKDGTKAEGTHCEDKGKGNKKDYERFGKGTAKKQVCPGNKDLENGLCYEDCRSGYNGEGPVCWGKTPPRYEACGAGFAKNKGVCAEVTVAMTTSVAVDLANAIAANSGIGTAAACAASKAKAVPMAEAKLGAKAAAAMVKNGYDVAMVAWALAGIIEGPVRSLAEAAQANRLTPDKMAAISAKLQSGLADVKKSHSGKGWEVFEEVFSAKGGGNIAAQWADPMYAVRQLTSFISLALSVGLMAQPCNPPIELFNAMLSVVSAYTWPVYAGQ